jgi:hypothetical protein
VMKCDFNAVWRDDYKTLRYHGTVTVTWQYEREIHTAWTCDTRPGQVWADPAGSERGTGVTQPGARQYGKRP